MANNNETVAEIADTVRHLADNLNNGIFLTKGQCNYIAHRIEAAHNREVAAKDREIELLEMALKISNGMNDAAAEMAVAKNEEIVMLRELLKEAVASEYGRCHSRWACVLCGKDYCKVKRWRKALEGAKDA